MHGIAERHVKYEKKIRLQFTIDRKLATTLLEIL